MGWVGDGAVGSTLAMAVEWGKGCWVLQGSSTCNWNYHFRNKVRVLAPSCSGYKYPYSSCAGGMG